MTASRKPAYHHGDLRGALMRTALLLIEQHGVQGLALSDAARLSGVSVAAPYRHFKDKEALLADIATEGFALFRNALARAMESHPGDGVKRLVEMGVAYVEFALDHPSHFKVMWEGVVPKDKYPQLRQAAHQAYLLLQQAVLDLLPKSSPARQQALIVAAWSIAHGYATLALGRELEVVTKQKIDKKLLRQSLHLLVDQFAAD
ncbi:MAG: TetR/AcrR family transcriptional regulator [Acidobacteriaceae bacterium]